ncbi:hypothetical protein JXL21_04955 [Candidatus Bathyarchaeota archaeon]|nr:hypothetical protein [Candidatus Bathyarchaeota archaeon]
MSGEKDTKKLLEFRESMEQRIGELETELGDLRAAIAVIDKNIVSGGFRTPTPPKPAPAKPQQPAQAAPQPAQEAPAEPEPDDVEDGMSITSKDGTVLGRMRVEGKSLTFTPQPEYGFTTDMPPFQSFLIERVLGNMNANDQERAANGEIELGEVLEYEVEEDGGKLLGIEVRNYGGERRLREINSSLRWTLDKMYDKLRQG